MRVGVVVGVCGDTQGSGEGEGWISRLGRG